MATGYGTALWVHKTFFVVAVLSHHYIKNKAYCRFKPVAIHDMERLKLNIFSPLDYVVFASKSAVEEGRGDGGDCSKLNEANFIKTDPVHNTLGTVLQSHSYGALLRLSFVAKDSRKADNNMNPGLHAELATGKQ